MTAPATADGDDHGPRSAGPDTDVERLSRWHGAGGGWRVVGRGPASLTVALLTCDGGEEMDRIVSSDPALVRYVDAWSREES